MAKVKIDDYGMTYCEKCGAEILCDEYGNMPEICPLCGELLDWSEFKEGTRGE